MLIDNRDELLALAVDGRDVASVPGWVEGPCALLEMEVVTLLLRQFRHGCRSLLACKRFERLEQRQIVSRPPFSVGDACYATVCCKKEDPPAIGIRHDTKTAEIGRPAVTGRVRCVTATA